MVEYEGMTKKEGKNKGRGRVRFDSASEFWKTVLTLLAVFLTFAGPTYLVYMFINVLKMNYHISLISGSALLVVGITLIWYLVKNEIIS